MNPNIKDPEASLVLIKCSKTKLIPNHHWPPSATHELHQFNRDSIPSIRMGTQTILKFSMAVPGREIERTLHCSIIQK